MSDFSHFHPEDMDDLDDERPVERTVQQNMVLEQESAAASPAASQQDLAAEGLVAEFQEGDIVLVNFDDHLQKRVVVGISRIDDNDACYECESVLDRKSVAFPFADDMCLWPAQPLKLRYPKGHFVLYPESLDSINMVLGRLQDGVDLQYDIFAHKIRVKGQSIDGVRNYVYVADKVKHRPADVFFDLPQMTERDVIASGLTLAGFKFEYQQRQVEK